MPRADSVQLNIRSRFARDRATEIARASGMTTTQVIEEALRAYAPPPPDKPPGRLVRRGPILVLTGGPTITLEETNAQIEAARIERE